MNETPQFLSFNQHLNIWWDNCSAWIIGVNIRSHFSSSLISWHTLLPQIIPSIVKMEYLRAFIWVYCLQVSQGAIRITFSFSCFETRLSFLSIWSWKKNSRNFTYFFCNWGINVVTVVLSFRSYSSLIDHSCFKNALHLTLWGYSL